MLYFVLPELAVEFYWRFVRVEKSSLPATPVSWRTGGGSLGEVRCCRRKGEKKWIAHVVTCWIFVCSDSHCRTCPPIISGGGQPPWLIWHRLKTGEVLGVWVRDMKRKEKNRKQDRKICKKKTKIKKQKRINTQDGKVLSSALTPPQEQSETVLSCHRSGLCSDVVSEVRQLRVLLPLCSCKNKHKPSEAEPKHADPRLRIDILFTRPPRMLRFSQKTHYSSGAGARCSSFEQIHILISNTEKPKSLLLTSELHIGCFLFLLHFSSGGAGLYLPVTAWSRPVGYS